jgi:hypothetical protein
VIKRWKENILGFGVDVDPLRDGEMDFLAGEGFDLVRLFHFFVGGDACHAVEKKP